MDGNKKKEAGENKLKHFIVILHTHTKKTPSCMHAPLSYSEFLPVGHGYLNSLSSCPCIISTDMGLPTQVQRAEHLPIAELFNLEKVEIFINVLAASIVKTTV